MISGNSVIALLALLLVSLPLTVNGEGRGVTVVPKQEGREVPWGDYHALIIGINQYQEWPHLRTAVKDAEGLKTILVERYGFDDKKTVLLVDTEATRRKILNDLRTVASNLKGTDNLLVYFAGHGQLDDLTGDGYWIPVEGKQKEPVSWVSHSDIKNILSSERVKAKNIVVVADSCYSGALLRGGPSLLSLEDRNYRGRLIELASKRSRQVITSGGLEPVVDGGRDGHSLFAYYFIKALGDNEKEVIDLENLFHGKVWKPVTEIGGQRPSVGRLKTPMDEDGQFVLELKLKITIPQSSVSPGVPERDKELAEERERLVRERQEVERLRLDIEKKRIEEERRRLEEEKARLETASIPAKPQPPPAPTHGQETGRDGVYIAYANGVVRDTKTGLEWVAGPDKNTTWDEAKAWVESLNVGGGGWRMPMLNELEELYQRGKGAWNMTPLFKTTGWFMWSGQTEGSSGAWGFRFSYGIKDWNSRSLSIGRAFAVQPVQSSKPSQPPELASREEIPRNETFIAYANGIVKDTKTGLEWLVGPDWDTTWGEAKAWVESLNIGSRGWRMPTVAELEGLYDKGKGNRNMTPLLKTTGWFVWSDEEKVPSAAWAFFFGTGYKSWYTRTTFFNYRAFAVRARSDG